MTSTLAFPTVPGYTLLEQLYSGSRTTVYRGTDNSEQQPVVVKILRRDYPSFNELVQFRNQYAITKNLNLPGIVKPLRLAASGHRDALILEDFGGIALGEYLQQHRLTLDEVLEIALQLADILHDLIEERVVHKDIKPANILINSQSKKIKLIDFSIASLLPKESQEIQNPNILEGTLAYLAPEQTGRMNRGIDYRTDFYALGVTFYQLLTHRLPFAADDPLELVHCHIAKTPPAVEEVNAEIPSMLGSIVAKLMAKNAEDRYQSALGLKFDLERCLQFWQETGAIPEFQLGERDVSDRFNIPEKLYGREEEVSQLLEAFDRVAAGASELMLVAGYSGIGKTAVVNEVHKPITRQKGYFIKGKFDQFNRNIPLSAFVQALRDLMGQLLCESDEALAQWKAKILEAVGENGQVLIEVIPELERIIGPQPDAPELSGDAVQNRFDRLFGKFIAVFTAPEHPLVLFLDDLQWSDLASLKLMQLLMEDNGCLLILGAYRDNEVSPVHPLMVAVEALKKAGKTVNTLTLAPLALADLNDWVADTLHCSRNLAQPLTELIARKTKGNPFFTTQFLKALYEDREITFNRRLGSWQCDLARVQTLTLAEDVVEFMAARVQKLPVETQNILKLAACIGNQFDLETLAIVSQQTPAEAATALWKALQDGAIVPTSQVYKFFQGWEPSAVEHKINPSYRFLHDRVQQAAYSLIAEARRQATHYSIGKLLLEKIDPTNQQERIFEIVNQLNIGVSLIETQAERERLGELNLIACRKARKATACVVGLEYAKIGLSCLGERAWFEQYELTLEFHQLAAELAFMSGDYERMDDFIDRTIERARTPLDQVNVYLTKILSLLPIFQFAAALDTADVILTKLGQNIPRNPTEAEVQQLFFQLHQLLGGRKIRDLVNLPAMTDPESIATVQILNSISSCAYANGSSLFPFICAFGVKLSIERGNTGASAPLYAFYSIIACEFLNDIDSGYDFGELAIDIANAFDAKLEKTKVLMLVGTCVRHRKSPLRETLPILQEGYAAGLAVGNFETANNNFGSYALNSFWSGKSLATLEPEIVAHILDSVKSNQALAATALRMYMWRPIAKLAGIPDEFDSIIGDQESLHSFDREEGYFALCTETDHALGIALYCFNHSVAAYLMGELELARKYAGILRPLLRAAAGLFGVAVFYFYDSLMVLAELKSGSSDSQELLNKVQENQENLQQFWVNYAPQNHQHKFDLVEAEKCRVLGQNYQAADYYDRAIAGAKANGFTHEEALSNELTAEFYLDGNKEKIAAGYLQEAYYCYARWGAKAKVQDLERRYPQLLAPILQTQRTALAAGETLASTTFTTLSSQSSTTGSTSISTALDLATVLKASQTLSREIQLDKLLATLLHTVLENAGADKGALLMPKESEWFVEAVATLNQPARVESIPLRQSNEIPHSAINTVRRTLEPMVIADATLHPKLSADPYLAQQPPKSLLCIPILGQGKLAAILYLENRIAAAAFTQHRVELLNLLCTQAAISLENARLYRQAQQALQDLQQAQLQIVQSEKMATLGNLVAGVAHEINNPVGFLKGSINNGKDYVRDLLEHLALYQECYPEPADAIADNEEEIDIEFLSEDLPKLLDSMRGATDRITSISTSLRTFSRADTETPISANIHDGLESTLLILKYRLKANDKRPAIQVEKNYGELPEIECFPGQLNQVFMNILANAIDALEEADTGRSFAEIEAHPNRITIRTRTEGARALVAIADNGSGMSPEVKAKIFDHLFTTKAVGKGTGLGLAIARQIVEEKHGGRLQVRSELGRGTEFCIQLPLADAEMDS